MLFFSGGVDSSLLAARAAALGRTDIQLLNYAFGQHDPEAAHAQRVAAHLPKRRIQEKLDGPRHLLATAGADAAALGVASLPIYEAFAPAPQVLLKKTAARV